VAMIEVLKPDCWDETCQRCHERVSAIQQCENFAFVLAVLQLGFLETVSFDP